MELRFVLMGGREERGGVEGEGEFEIVGGVREKGIKRMKEKEGERVENVGEWGK